MSFSVSVKDSPDVSRASSSSMLNRNSGEVEPPKRKRLERINFWSKSDLTPEEKKKREVPANDDYKATNRFKLYMLIIWMGCIAVTIWYIVQQAQAYMTAVNNPVSTVLIDVTDRLPLPQATICNWNQIPDDRVPCPQCKLQLQSCQYNYSVDCYSQWSKRQYHTNAGTFECYDFNAFPYSVMYSDTTGYSGAYSLIFSVPLYPKAAPGEVPSNRSGLQVSFFAAGQITPQTVYDEIRFAPIGYDSFYSLQLINTIHSELPFFDQDYNTTSFDTPVTTVNLLPLGKKMVNGTYTGYVGVSFSYQTLSKQTIYFGIGYTLSSLFGDLASVIGTITGIDLIKLSVGFGLSFIAWRHKDIDLLADLFNG